MKWMFASLVVLLVLLQARLWVGDGSLAEIARLERSLERQQLINSHDAKRNKTLEIEIAHLSKGLGGIEELAREDMGMIQEGETFYLVVDSRSASR
ncbi:FtsB family cell division protein [Halioxenophilus aromaticivorans]|uniref:Cell division protein FtsB n=1 Tax=Halioxenophilus aromaticivorans TaxID=1306992 RepID=A0AAV3U9T3_9ALTE